MITLITPQNWLERFWQYARVTPCFGLIGDSLNCGANFPRKSYLLILKYFLVQKDRRLPVTSADKTADLLKIDKKRLKYAGRYQYNTP